MCNSQTKVGYLSEALEAALKEAIADSEYVDICWVAVQRIIRSLLECNSALEVIFTFFCCPNTNGLFSKNIDRIPEDIIGCLLDILSNIPIPDDDDDKNYLIMLNNLFDMIWASKHCELLFRNFINEKFCGETILSIHTEKIKKYNNLCLTPFYKELRRNGGVYTHELS